MAIKDKDGSILKLKGPNALMENQLLWDQRRVSVINMSYDVDIVKDEQNPQKEFLRKHDVKDIGEELGLIDVTRSVSPEEFISEIRTPVEQDVLKKAINFWCVPMTWAESRDELYGEVRRFKRYGAKFQFSAIIVEESDLSLEFWTETPISVESVVYPQNQSKRWWKIDQIEEKSGGYLTTASTSDLNPDFS